MPNMKQRVEKELLRLEKAISLKKQELAELELQRQAAIAYIKNLDPKSVPVQYKTKRDVVAEILNESTEAIRHRDIKERMLELGFDEITARNNIGPALHQLLKDGRITKEGHFYKIV
jgi:hypothetical protein